MHTIRHATERDAELITQHRHRMFIANDLASEEQLAAMDEKFLPWVRERLGDGRYTGLLSEDDGECIASAGIFFADFPPHFLHIEPCRPYLLNFYTADHARGRGLANELLRACVEECHRRGHTVITLHASKFGRPIYKKFGFEDNNEMMLKQAASK